MPLKNEPTNNSRPSAPAPSAVAISSPNQQSDENLAAPIDQLKINRRSQYIPMPKQLLNCAEIRSRFEQISGKGMPKRMTTGKFVYLGPTIPPPDNPL